MYVSSVLRNFIDREDIHQRDDENWLIFYMMDMTDTLENVPIKRYDKVYRISNKIHTKY